MQLNLKTVSAIELSGSVIMYGHISVIAERTNDQVEVTKTSGADGYAPDSESHMVPPLSMDKILDELSDLDLPVVQEDDQSKDYIVESDLDLDAVTQWMLILSFEDETETSITGYDPSGDVYNSLITILSRHIPEFGDVKSFFENV